MQAPIQVLHLRGDNFHHVYNEHDENVARVTLDLHSDRMIESGDFAQVPTHLGRAARDRADDLRCFIRELLLIVSSNLAVPNYTWIPSAFSDITHV